MWRRPVLGVTRSASSPGLLGSLSTLQHHLSSFLVCSFQFLPNVKQDNKLNRMVLKIRPKQTRTLGFWSLSPRDLPSGEKKTWRHYSWALDGACFFYVKRWFLIYMGNTQVCSWHKSFSHYRSAQWGMAWTAPSLLLCLVHLKLPSMALGSWDAFGTGACESWSSC